MSPRLCSISCHPLLRSSRVGQKYNIEEYVLVFPRYIVYNSWTYTRPLDFQLAFSPAHFRNERMAWRTIIQLNLIRSVSLN